METELVRKTMAYAFATKSFPWIINSRGPNEPTMYKGPPPPKVNPFRGTTYTSPTEKVGDIAAGKLTEEQYTLKRLQIWAPNQDIVAEVMKILPKEHRTHTEQLLRGLITTVAVRKRQYTTHRANDGYGAYLQPETTLLPGHVQPYNDPLVREILDDIEAAKNVPKGSDIVRLPDDDPLKPNGLISLEAELMDYRDGATNAPSMYNDGYPDYDDYSTPEDDLVVDDDIADMLINECRANVVAEWVRDNIGKMDSRYSGLLQMCTISSRDMVTLANVVNCFLTTEEKKSLAKYLSAYLDD